MVVASMISKPLSQIIEIPNESLNQKLVAANDNLELTALSRDHIEAESVLTSRGDVTQGRSPILIALVLSFLVGLYVLGFR